MEHEANETVFVLDVNNNDIYNVMKYHIQEVPTKIAYAVCIVFELCYKPIYVNCLKCYKVE